MRTVPARLFAIGLVLAIAGAVVGAGSIGAPQPRDSSGQSSTQQVATAALSGVVVDAVTDAPIADATVALDAAGLPSNTRQFTDAKGRFVFVNLPASEHYTLTTTRPGYVEGSYGRTAEAPAAQSLITLRDGEWLQDVHVKMWHPGVITGTVTDERGDPVVRVSVRVLTRVRLQGSDVLAAAGSATTDDRGRYRVADLGPGRYVVMVPSVQASFDPASTAPILRQLVIDSLLDQSQNTRLQLGYGSLLPPPPAATGRRFAYPASFHPSAGGVAQANTVELGLAQQKDGVDVVLAPTPTVRVSGRIEGPADVIGGSTVRLRAPGFEGLGNGSEVATALTTADGHFIFLGVPAGSYALDFDPSVTALGTGGLVGGLGGPPGTTIGNWRPLPEHVGGDGSPLRLASTPYNRGGIGTPTNAFGHLDVSVGETDVEDLVLPVRAAGTLSGRLVIEHTSVGALPSMASALSALTLESASANLRYGLVSQNRPNPADPPEAFTMSGLGPAPYVFRIQLSGWVVKSVECDGKDCSATPLDAASTTDFSNVVVTITDAGAALSGNVSVLSSSGGEPSVVLVFPADRARWTNYGFNSPSFARVTASPSGSYLVTNLPPGNYVVVAVDHAPWGDWLDPEFLARLLPLATPVSLDWGGSRRMDLAVKAVPR